MTWNDIPTEVWVALAALAGSVTTAFVNGRLKSKDQQLIEIGKLWERVDKLSLDRDALALRVDELRSEVSVLKQALAQRESDVEMLRKRIVELETEIAHCGDVQKHKSLNPTGY